MDAKTKFEKALEERKRQKAEEASRSSYSGAGFPDIPYAPLNLERQQAFRFVGLPHLVREKPTDSKRIHMAMILADDEKKFRCIGHDPNTQKGWFLYRVMDKVLTRHWDKALAQPDGRVGGYVYDYAHIHPEIYNRVAKNNIVGNAMEKGWRFSPSILFNVIDRANYAWHEENKKLKVLSKKAGEWQNKVFFEAGVPDRLFELIMDDIVACDGNTNWEDYDIVIRKVEGAPWYKVYHGVDDIKKLDEEVRSLIVNAPLSEEERSWELNDLDKLFPVTGYNKIKSKLGLFIQEIDRTFKTKFYDELVALVEKEEAEIAERQMKFPPEDEGCNTETASESAKNKEASSSGHSSFTSQPAATTPCSPSVSTPSSSQAAQATANGLTRMTDEIWAGLADGSYNGKKYLGVPLMSAEERAMVIGIYPNGSFEWHPEAGEPMEGQASGFLTAELCTVDPLDGRRF